MAEKFARYCQNFVGGWRNTRRSLGAESLHKFLNWKASVEKAECGKCGLWKVRSVENAECGKCRTSQFQYEINKSNSFIFSLKECFIILWHLRVKRINARSTLTIDLNSLKSLYFHGRKNVNKRLKSMLLALLWIHEIKKRSKLFKSGMHPGLHFNG